MSCVFHALVMGFHKEVYPNLPHKRDNSRELTKIGKLYCKWVLLLSHQSCPHEHLNLLMTSSRCH